MVLVGPTSPGTIRRTQQTTYAPPHAIYPDTHLAIVQGFRADVHRLAMEAIPTLLLTIAGTQQKQKNLRRSDLMQLKA